jgi:serine/threonine protein kinase
MDPQIPQPGELVAGRLRVERVLGSGGMGVVLAARHEDLGELVAVKMLRLPSGDGRSFERLRREARAAAKLRGEHVVRVMDVGTLENGAPFIVMEYVAGRTLAQAREAAGRIAVPTAVDWVLQACEGLAEAHGLGIVHRDIKPSNLLLTTRPDGSSLIKLLDFGIAKSLSVLPTTLTETGGFLGSPLYASPEQVRDARVVDHRTDVWSMGVVLYQLVTGALPFPSYTATAAIASLAADPPVAPRSVVPDLPLELERVLLRCLEKDPQNRFATVAELARALEPLGSDASAGATARVGRILNQAGKQPSESPSGLDTLSTFAPSQDGSLAASRTASQVLQPPAGLPRSRRFSPWWPIAATAVTLVSLAVWDRGAKRSAALAEVRSASTTSPLVRAAPVSSTAPVSIAPPSSVMAPVSVTVPSAVPVTSALAARVTSAVARSPGERSVAPRVQPSSPVVAVSAPSIVTPAAKGHDEDDFGPRK